jgi:polysaccharide biosynthesis protein PslJ
MAATATSRQATARTLPRWPVQALFLAFPLWWVLGLGPFIWSVLALPMAFALAVRGHVRVPRGFGIWLLFLIWMLGSGIKLDSGLRTAGWAYRASLYLAATVFLLYLCNASRESLSVRRMTLILAGFWAFIVVGGYLGIFFPHGNFSTPVEAAMPPSLLANSYVYNLVHPSFAQLTSAGGVTPRPQAPFTYTNEWGAAYALLIPMVLIAIGRLPRGPLRAGLLLLLPISLVPAMLTLNRGLYLSLGAGLLYAGLRFALRGRVKALIGVFVLLCVAGAVAAILPVQQLLQERVSSTHSNRTRVSVYKQAVVGVSRSPLLGYGAPRPAEEGPGAPSVGTQGQFWMVLFSHGIPGATLFVGWYLASLWHSRKALTAPWLWAHVALFIAVVQLPFYGQLPEQLFVIMAAVALASRERDHIANVPAPMEAPSRRTVGRKLA